MTRSVKSLYSWQHSHESKVLHTNVMNKFWRSPIPITRNIFETILGRFVALTLMLLLVPFDPKLVNIQSPWIGIHDNSNSDGLFWLNLYLFKGWLTSFYYEWSWGDWKFIKLCLEAASVEVVSQEQRQNCKVGSFPTSRNGLEQSDFLQYTRFYYITFWLVCQANRTHFWPWLSAFLQYKGSMKWMYY